MVSSNDVPRQTKKQLARYANLLGVLAQAECLAKHLALALKVSDQPVQVGTMASFQPIVADGQQVDAWVIINRSGAEGLTHVTIDGELYCHDSDDLVPHDDGRPGRDRVPHYIRWSEHIEHHRDSDPWMRVLGADSEQIERAIGWLAYPELNG